MNFEITSNNTLKCLKIKILISQMFIKTEGFEVPNMVATMLSLRFFP